MDTYKEVLYAAGLQALISTRITLLYLLLKAYQFAVYALPHQTEGRLAKTMMAKDPVAHMMTPQEYLQKMATGKMLKMNNHEMMVELAAKNDQTQLLMMEFRDIESPKNK